MQKFVQRRHRDGRVQYGVGWAPHPLHASRLIQTQTGTCIHLNECRQHVSSRSQRTRKQKSSRKNAQEYCSCEGDAPELKSTKLQRMPSMLTHTHEILWDDQGSEEMGESIRRQRCSSLLSTLGSMNISLAGSRRNDVCLTQ